MLDWSHLGRYTVPTLLSSMDKVQHMPFSNSHFEAVTYDESEIKQVVIFGECTVLKTIIT